MFLYFSTLSIFHYPNASPLERPGEVDNDKRAEQETAIRKDAVCVGFNKDYLNLPPAFQYLQGLIKAFILTKDKSYKITKGK